MDEQDAGKWFNKIKGAHAAGCMFKEIGKLYPLREFGTLDPSTFAILSRKLFYIRW